MKKIFLIFFILVSCNKESNNNLELNQLFCEYSNLEQERISNQLNELKKISTEKPKEYKLEYKNAINLNELITRFENQVLGNKNNDSINTYYKILKEKIISQKLISRKSFEDELHQFNYPIENQIQKLILLKSLKKLLYKVNNWNIIMANDGTSNTNIKPSSISLSRLNDSTLILNIYNNVIKDYSFRFNENSISINKIVDKNDKEIKVLLKNDNVVDSYQIKTKSDTIFLATDIKTKDGLDFLISEHKSHITVGDFINFDKDYIIEFLGSESE